MRAAGSGKVQKLVEVLEAFHLHAVDFFHNGGAHLGVSQCSLGGQGHQEDHDFIHAFFPYVLFLLSGFHQVEGGVVLAELVDFSHQGSRQRDKYQTSVNAVGRIGDEGGRIDQVPFKGAPVQFDVQRHGLAGAVLSLAADAQRNGIPRLGGVSEQKVGGNGAQGGILN